MVHRIVRPAGLHLRGHLPGAAAVTDRSSGTPGPGLLAQGCTTKMTTTDQFADLAGSLTIDGTTVDQTGFVDVFTSTSVTHCK